MVTRYPQTAVCYLCGRPYMVSQGHACGCTPHIPRNDSPEEETHDTPTQGSPCLRLPVLCSRPSRTLHVGWLPVLRHGSSVARTLNAIGPDAVNVRAGYRTALLRQERTMTDARQRNTSSRQYPSARPGRAAQPPRCHVRGCCRRGGTPRVRPSGHPAARPRPVAPPRPVLTGTSVMTARVLARLAAACRHYFVKKNGVWTCDFCGETR